MPSKIAPFATIMRRLTQAGFSFENQPTRLHNQRHGQLIDTFFVYHEPRYRHPLSTFVGWRFKEQAGGLEAIIDRSLTTSIQAFARGPLWAIRDRNSSGYGVALCVTSSVPTVSDEQLGIVMAQLNA